MSTDLLDTLIRYNAPWAQDPWMRTSIVLCVLGIIAWIANWVAKRIVLRSFLHLLERSPFEIEVKQVGVIVGHIAHALPAFLILVGIDVVPGLPAKLVGWVHGLCMAVIIMTFALAVSAGLTLANEVYLRRPDAGHRPIKGYVQVAKLLVYVTAVILVVAALMNQSPLLLLSGLGAITAVLLLVFKDTILSLVASVQITSSDLVRVGDWIELPKMDVNGDVIDIALHTIKVQNFDMTITSIPTYRLITESFRNWRGMSESGGRRMMRSLKIDQGSIHFLDDDALGRLGRFSLLKDYLVQRQQEVRDWNTHHAGEEAVNARRLTNIGTFRAYVRAYLQAHPEVDAEKMLMVRQLEPSEHGLPLQVYAFTSQTALVNYEKVQADIFDHLLAIMPEFGLRLFQNPTGADLSGYPFKRTKGELEV